MTNEEIRLKCLELAVNGFKVKTQQIDDLECADIYAAWVMGKLENIDEEEYEKLRKQVI